MFLYAMRVPNMLHVVSIWGFLGSFPGSFRSLPQTFLSWKRIEVITHNILEEGRGEKEKERKKNFYNALKTREWKLHAGQIEGMWPLALQQRCHKMCCIEAICQNARSWAGKANCTKPKPLGLPQSGGPDPQPLIDFQLTELNVN